MPSILVQGQTENPILVQKLVYTLSAGANRTTVTLTSNGWDAFVDNNWAGVVNMRTAGTSGFIESVGATTCLLVHSTNNTSAVDIIGVGRKA